MTAFVAAMLASLIVLLPIGRTAEAPLLGVLVAAFVLAWRMRRDGPAWRAVVPVLALFAAYWLPAFASAFDAQAPDHAWSTVAGTLRFAPFALGAVLALRGAPSWQLRLQRATGAIVALWALDALVQAVTGWSLGGQLHVDRVSGVFGDDNLKLGPTLAVLSPFALVVARREYGRAALFSTWLLLASAVLLAGARAGWLMFALVSVAIAWRETASVRRFALWCGGGLVLLALLGTFAYFQSALVAQRVDRTFAVLRGDEAALDFALANRLPIWHTASAMARAHPVNGVGVRGFRYAYREFAAPGDQWVRPDSDTGALHPHQLLLELLAETGVVGLLAWLAGAVVAVRAWRRAKREARALAWPSGVALLAMTFPLNTHFAFYSAFWGLVFWWLLATWCAALSPGETQ